MKNLFALHRLSTRYDEVLSDWGGSLASLAIRFYVGWQFFKAGMVKVNDWGATLALFHDEYKVPLLLFVGLFSRPAALALFMVNAMAVISYPQLFSFECPAAINDHLYWGILLLVLVATGPGRFSLDALIGRKLARSPGR